jgi:hypothetical protein
MAGRPMRDYVVMPGPLVADPAELEPWVAKALAYAAALPPKAPKPTAAKGKPAPKPKPTGAAGSYSAPRARTRVSPAAKIPPRRTPGRQGPSRGH